MPGPVIPRPVDSRLRGNDGPVILALRQYPQGGAHHVIADLVRNPEGQR